ncbi:MAG: ArsR/SmtB family transcription factor [bacterium]
MDQDEIIAISRALSNDTRYRILREIPANGKKCCKDLSQCFSISKPTVTHHINKLRELDLVEGLKEETFHYLTRNQEKLDEFAHAIEADFAAPTKS